MIANYLSRSILSLLMSWLLLIVPNHGWLTVYFATGSCCCSLQQQEVEKKSCCQAKALHSTELPTGELPCLSETCGCGCVDVPLTLNVTATLPRKLVESEETLPPHSIDSAWIDYNNAFQLSLPTDTTWIVSGFLDVSHLTSAHRCARLCRWLI